MSDFGTPVAGQNAPPSALATLESLMSIKQRAQALQTGQYQQQSAQANAQQAQQEMSERKFYQQMMSTQKDDQGNSIMNSQGEPDPSIVSAAAFRKMPLLGQSVVQHILKTQTDKLGLANASRELSDNYRNDLSGIVRSFVGTPSNPQDIQSALSEYSRDKPEAAPAVGYASKLINTLSNAPADKRDLALTHLAQQIQPSSVTEKEQQPNEQLIGQTVQDVNPYSPTTTAPPGANVDTLSTKDRLPQQTTNAAGQIINRAPLSGALSAAPQIARSTGPAGASSQDLNPTSYEVSGKSGAATGMATLDTQTMGNVKAVADQAPVTKNLLNAVKTLAGSGTTTGPGSMKQADAETFIAQHIPGFQSLQTAADKRALLGKTISQLMLQTAQASGMNTDQAHASTAHALPDPEHMSGEALSRAVDIVMGQTQIAAARGAVHRQFLQGHGNNQQGLAAVDSNFMQNLDPRAFDYVQMPAAQRKAFMADPKNFPTSEARKEFADKLSVISHMGGFNYAQ